MNQLQPYRDIRPWGEELWLTKGTEKPSMVKIISVNPGESLSLQYHHNRSEYWIIVSGDGTAEIDGVRIPLTAGSTCFIAKEIKHRISGGKEKMTFIELAFGEFDEKDIVRLEDKYGRVNS